MFVRSFSSSLAQSAYFVTLLPRNNYLFESFLSSLVVKTLNLKIKTKAKTLNLKTKIKTIGYSALKTQTKTLCLKTKTKIFKNTFFVLFVALSCFWTIGNSVFSN